MASREHNERKFGPSKALPGGGRRYVKVIVGRARGSALYVKDVDANEETVRFAQEIYDASGRQIEVHEKFPVDLGHKKS